MVFWFEENTLEGGKPCRVCDECSLSKWDPSTKFSAAKSAQMSRGGRKLKISPTLEDKNPLVGQQPFNSQNNRLPISLLHLPPEIRNQVYEEVILQARTCVSGCLGVTQHRPPRSLWKRAQVQATTSTGHHLIGVQIAGKETRIKGLSSMGLLFVCKQIHNELIDLVYSEFDHLTIIPILFHNTEEWRTHHEFSPMTHLPYQNLDAPPHVHLHNLQPVVTSFKLYIPSELTGKLLTNCKGMLKGCITRKRYSPWPNFKDLVAYVKGIENLRKVEIIVDCGIGNTVWEELNEFNESCWMDYLTWLLPLNDLRELGIPEFRLKFINCGWPERATMMSRSWERCLRKRYPGKEVSMKEWHCLSSSV
jgi:hypothetical protein